jgi:hypothetical protein
LPSEPNITNSTNFGLSSVWSPTTRKRFASAPNSAWKSSATFWLAASAAASCCAGVSPRRRRARRVRASLVLRELQRFEIMRWAICVFANSSTSAD